MVLVLMPFGHGQAYFINSVPDSIDKCNMVPAVTKKHLRQMQFFISIVSNL